MNKSDFLYYKNLLLAQQRGLSTGKALVASFPAPSEIRGDPVDMAANETSAAMQVQVKQTESKLLRAIEDALARIRQGRFGTREECGQPIGQSRLEAVPWTRRRRECKDQQD
jgi:DnaK suppressor protein